MNIDNKEMSVFLDQVSDTLVDDFSNKTDLKDFESIPINQNECFHVVDFVENNLIYHRGFESLLGYTSSEISIKFIEGLYHPEDSDMINRIIQSSILYTLKVPDCSLNNKLFITFRLKKQDGSYIKVLSQSTICEVDVKGRMTRTLIKFTNVSFMDMSGNVSWDFHANNLNKKAFKKEIYIVYNDFFTKRETEIIVEIAKGLTNIQIGKKLHISELTVATHRKSIFKKANCHNSKGLLLFCQEKGII